MRMYCTILLTQSIDKGHNILDLKYLPQVLIKQHATSIREITA